MKYLIPLLLLSAHTPARASALCATASNTRELIACVNELSKEHDKLKDKVEFLERDNDLLQKQIDTLRKGYKYGK